MQHHTDTLLISTVEQQTAAARAGVRACVRAQSMCRCVESIKCQVCQLTKSNECAKRQRDEICRCNQAYKARVRELEKDLNRANSVIDCLREKVGYYSGRDERRSGRRRIS